MINKKITLLITVVLSMVAVSACAQTDVIANASLTSFNEILKAMPDSVTSDEVNAGWSLEAPDKSARFIWGKDYSKTPMYDVMLEFDAKPFIDAGLDTSKLDESVVVVNDKLQVGRELGDKEVKYDGDVTPFTSFEQIIKIQRDAIGFHIALDHFNVDIGNGNKFEWAKDMSKNDKDIVFVLDPQVFIDAGVKPENVEGWTFAKVEVMDAKGKPVQVDKFLKPFNLK